MAKRFPGHLPKQRGHLAVGMRATITSIILIVYRKQASLVVVKKNVYATHAAHGTDAQLAMAITSN
jgi:hypothetical protein